MRTVAPRFLLALGALAVLATGCPRRAATLNDAIGDYGYNPASAPSTLVPVGTIVYVRQRQPSLQVGILCTQQAAFGDGLPVLQSPTATLELARATNREFSLDAEAKKEIIRKIGGSLGIKNAAVESSSLSGQGLYRGILEEARLARMSARRAGSSAAATPKLPLYYGTPPLGKPLVTP